jgi:hypothetical protein
VPLLASDIRNASGDVDAVFLSGGKAVFEIAGLVAEHLGLPRDWINEGVKRVAPPRGDPQPNLILAGQYPRTPPEFDCRTACSCSDASLHVGDEDPGQSGDRGYRETESDLTDAVALMKVTTLTTELQLVDLLI